MDAIKEDVAEYTVVVGDKKSAAKLHLDEENLVDIITPLKQITACEHQSAMFKCELSCDLDIKPIWLKDMKPLLDCNKYIQTSDSCVHTLTICDLNYSDEAEYSISIGDKTSSAILTVEGKGQGR